MLTTSTDGQTEGVPHALLCNGRQEMCLMDLWLSAFYISSGTKDKHRSHYESEQIKTNIYGGILIALSRSFMIEQRGLSTEALRGHQ